MAKAPNRPATKDALSVGDGLQNLVSGMGTSRDKAVGATYVWTVITPQEALTTYRESALARRVVDLPAEDSCREWREWQAESADITLIEAEEKRLGVQGKVKAAQQLARLTGRAAILIGDGAANTEAPLDPAKMKKGGLKYLTVLDRDTLTPGELDLDVASEGFRAPKCWNLAAGDVSKKLHPSRVVIFYGIPPITSWDTEFGVSVLSGQVDAIKRVDEVATNVNSLVYEAKVDVLKIPNLMKQLAARGASFETEMLRRLTLAATGKGLSGMLVIDADEEYEQKSATFGSIPDVMDRFAQLCSAASGIPMTLLFGMSPAGLNATGESDVRLYYDRIRVGQTVVMTPAMAILDECLIMSSLGNRPDDLFYKWKPLWQPSENDTAANAEKYMNTLAKLDALQTTSPEAIGKAAVNKLTEMGAFPGLESYVEEFPFDPETDREDGDTMPGGDDTQEGGEDTMIGDAAPRTLYVSRKVKNAGDIIAWAKSQGIETTLPAEDMHVTIAFSRNPIDWFKVGAAWEAELKVIPGGPRQIETFGEGAKVLLFASHELKWRHEAIVREGASWDFPEYQPHITSTYGEIPEGVEPYQGEIVLGPEIFAEVNEDWKASVTEA